MTLPDGLFKLIPHDKTRVQNFHKIHLAMESSEQRQHSNEAYLHGIENTETHLLKVRVKSSDCGSDYIGDYVVVLTTLCDAMLQLEFESLYRSSAK
jgi:hypothetical protein